jgi:hypothetical protein
MSEKDLIDISKRPDFKELTSRGGSVRSDKKKRARLIQHSAQAKCKNCNLKCDFREACLVRDPECLCVVPFMRADAITDGSKVTEWNDEKIKNYLNKLIDMYAEIMIKNPLYEEKEDSKKDEMVKVRRLNTMYNRLIEMKQTYSPATQKSVNVNMNIDLFSKQMEEWKKSVQDMKEKEQVIVIDERTKEQKEKDEVKDIAG